MIRRVLATAAIGAAVFAVVPAAPASALLCNGPLTNCPCHVRDTYLSGCAGPIVTCERTPEAVICV
ncbi:MAG TPA: hypothetical protein VNA20_16640 [Frankiaceae bacterium]|nr:hypothetical protein [Frankiaceae bacterium]